MLRMTIGDSNGYGKLMMLPCVLIILIETMIMIIIVVEIIFSNIYGIVIAISEQKWVSVSFFGIISVKEYRNYCNQCNISSSSSLLLLILQLFSMILRCVLPFYYFQVNLETTIKPIIITTTTVSNLSFQLEKNNRYLLANNKK